MIKASIGHVTDGRSLILGLSDRNLDRLADGDPISFPGAEVGFPELGTIEVHAARTCTIAIVAHGADRTMVVCIGTDRFVSLRAGEFMAFHHDEGPRTVWVFSRPTEDEMAAFLTDQFGTPGRTTHK